ncbi:hypothetical protein F4776DRAFT_667298 [Hypoxylon sp. NC0597]|nr:hypothetical protein F4776DRAFT_667298 [Hypoxylon sp. NC0597]
MATSREDSFLILSSSDSSVNLLNDGCNKTNSTPSRPGKVDRASKMRHLTPIDTLSVQPEQSAEFLRSTVADALGIDASFLPQPFHELAQDQNDSTSTYSSWSDFQQLLDGAGHMRNGSESSVSVYSSPVDVETAAWRKSTGNVIEDLFTATVADVLDLDSSSLPFDESFVDLGGNHRKARELRKRCMEDGLIIKTRDIMNCKTIAELQTCITPLIPPEPTDNKISPTTATPLELDWSGMPAGNLRYHISDNTRPPAIPPKAPSRLFGGQSQLKPRQSRRHYGQVEQVLSLHPDVSSASLLKPKAGPFEGQLVAFLTLTSYTVGGPDDCEIKLQTAYYTSQLPKIRKAVESQVAPGLVPRIWIVLEKIPLDDTGKINRRKLQTWIQNANDELYRRIISIDSEENLKQPTSVTEKRLQKAASTALQIDQTSICMNMSFASLGGDENAAARFIAECESQGICLHADDVMQAKSLTQLAALATSSKSHSRNSSGVITEAFDLSAMQRLYFHTPMGCDNTRRRVGNGNYRFNQSILFRLNRSMSVEDVRAAVEAIVGHHPMLRCRFRPNGSSWCQYIEPNIPSSYHFAHHSVRTSTEVEEVIRGAQAMIDIETGPIFAAHHFHTYDGCQMIYMVAHHLVVDLKSWHIVADDMEGLLSSGCLVSDHTLSFKDWTLHCRHRISGMESPFDVPVGNVEYWGIDGASNTYGDTVAAGFTLGADVTSALEATCRGFKADPADVFVAALLLSFSQAFRDRSVPTLWNQQNERTALDIGLDASETVGWFTSLSPLAINASPADDILVILSRLKDSRHANSGNGVLQFAGNLKDAATTLQFASSHFPVELMFSYSGMIQSAQNHDTLLEQLPVPGKTLTSSTSDVGRDVGRISVFEVSVFIDQGETKLKFLYHRDAKHQEQIHTWIRSYEKLLRQAPKRLQNEAPGLSLSDVPYMDVTSEELGRFNTSILPSLSLDVSNIEAIYPVTAVQQNILTNQSLIPGSSQAQIIFDLDTSDRPGDVSRICAAWLQVSGRHPALRTVFSQSVSKNGLYDQIILRSHSPSMLFLESDSIEEALISVDNVPPLPLNEGTPWHRLVVCQVAGKTLLKLEVSQAICDFVSMTILFRELEQAYFHEQACSVPEISHFEYTKYMDVTTRNTKFWREHLCGVQPCRFPTLISQRSGPIEWETKSINLKIPSENLNSFAENHTIDMSTVLRVAWGLLLRTYIGTDSVCFGSRISGRDLPVEGFSNSVGSFSTVSVYRLVIPPDISIVQLLLDAEEERRKVRDHQHVPVTRIEHELKIKGDRLFNTCLSFGYEHVSDGSSGNTKCRHIKTEQASECDLSADIYFRGGCVTVDIGYRILTSQQASTVASAFGRAIEAILDSPRSVVKEVDLFSMRDHEQILAWNSMPQVDIVNRNTHQLIADHALLNPEIQAVCAWDGDLSYGDLHSLSVVLAKHLLSSGLKPQTPVPVIIERSRWAVVAMLAVLHAGAILVPVDADITSAFGWIIKTTGAGLVLASDHVRKYIDDPSTKVMIVNDNTISAILAQSVDTPLPQPAPHEIACILFSSGSSKIPKGISYSHGALATACAGQGPTLLMNPSSRVMHLSSYSVDVALSEIFTTLVNGGCVCVPSSSERIADFSTAARRMRVNWTYLTPTLSRKINPESLPDIAVVCFRTRHLDGDAYAPWIDKAKVLLVYGFAEAGPLGLSATEVTHSKTMPCFGNPFCGNFWIVSPEDNNRLMPVGALGELVIGGPTLASGFNIDDADVKTWIGKSTVCARSLLQKSGSRLLKTGHYVRYREEGEIEFISDGSEETEIDGRKFRLSDVEPRLRQCLGRGLDVVVETIAFNDPKSTPILAAFIELGDRLLPESEDLSRLSRTTRERLYLFKKTADMALQETLPSYMVPSAYIPVKRMPLTPALEVDRLELQRMIAGLSRKQLLRLAEVSNPQEVHDTSFKPLPLTQVEQGMRTIFAKVLRIEESSIKASDGFLSLGGDVVLAHDLIVECRRRGIGISIIDVLRDVSLAELCKGVAPMETPPTPIQETRTEQASSSNAFVDEAIAPQLGSDTGLIEDVAEASSLQATFVESGMLQNRGNVNYLTINITGLVDWHKLQNACFMLTKAHPILRTAFVSYGRQLYQTVLRSYRPEFLRYQCQSWRLGSSAAKLIRRDQTSPVDFRRPITKFFYLDAGKCSTLVMRLSRAQYDDRSVPMLVRDLIRFYSYTDRVIERPGFCDVVRAIQSTYSNEASQYWRALLANATMTQVVSQPSPANINLNSTTVRQKIPTGSLQHLGIPFETILKGAWSVVLSNLSGTDDVVFGQLVEGKNLNLPTGQPISDVIGPIGNIIPVRTRLPDIPITPYEYFRCIQSQLVASVPYENMQTSDIVQKCTSWPSWTRFSTVVYHQNHSEDEKLIDFAIGSASCRLSCMESNHQDSDIFIKSVMLGSEDVDVFLTFCEKRIPISFAEEILKMLCSVVSLLTSGFVMEPINLKGLSDNYSTSRIPLPAPKRELTVLSSVESVDPEQARTVHTIISTAWNTILDAQSLKVSDIRSVPFYEIWGALMPAAELARYYSENIPCTLGAEKTTFTMEEIIDHPTMMQQYELIIAKQQGPQPRHNKNLMFKNTQSVWGKGIRKFSSTPNSSNAKPSNHPAWRNHRPKGSTGSTSTESMTFGSGQSEDEELKEDSQLNTGILGTKKTNVKAIDAKVTRKGTSLFGRVTPAISD